MIESVKVSLAGETDIGDPLRAGVSVSIRCAVDGSTREWSAIRWHDSNASNTRALEAALESAICDMLRDLERVPA